ncbi:haloacid dehalogenase-like hydrolase domain-containing protein Sgpp [Pyrus ussuriensis x Pyrus communis]|uniref:Haloacid dehalogenase-like hydrolase domain-containing protein Sgpp n=1 Tax=Pyrus ussuriensis x Pyrus communis TaxID=2448454 RepID=A0A5N5HJZ4_9ROSA|nr:haloacid dehalogenase-like hydrolase domain-containing protein Sgpp [Pyrus ussuriensis x Pyrus communis]
MLALPSSRLVPCHHFPKTHLQKTHTRNPTKSGSPSLTMASLSSNAHALDRKSSLACVAPLEAILFDIDGTLCDSDPFHYYAFREMLQEVGFNGGVPITEEFFSEKITGGHNEYLCSILLPDWDIERARQFLVDKEAMFRRLISEKIEPLKGLPRLRQWIEKQGLRRAAVTNAPKLNAELILSKLKLTDFFEIVVLGEECVRAKPFPDPYLTALEKLNLSNEHAFIFEDSVSGVKAGVAAGMPVVGLGTRNPEEALINAGASFVIKDFDDPKLWEALEEIVKKAE